MSRGAFYCLFAASGFAGLIYESLWTQYLRLFLGHAAYAQSLVLVVFMGGMAGGAALCARVSARIANPLVVYAAVEAAVGILAMAFHPAFVVLTDWSYASLLPGLGSDGAVLAAKLAVACILILPQSLLLGATFPLMSAGIARLMPARAGESVAMLYFTNSLGAVGGVLASAYVLIAWLGLPGTLRAAGALNLAIALVVGALARPLSPIAPAGDSAQAARVLLGVAFFTGLASFVYEIVWIRMLSLVLGASTHSFELMLATFILGLALGGLAVRRRVDTSPEPARVLGWVQVAMALAALATLPVYDFTFGLMESLMRGLAKNDVGYALFNLAGGGIAAMVMLPATFFAGMTLPLITGALLRGGGGGEAAIGRAYAANTLGAIAGVVLAVHIGLPFFGLKGTLMTACAIDAALGLALLGMFGTRRAWTLSAELCAAAFILVGALVKLDANKMTAGVFRHSTLEVSRDAKVLYARDGKTATVHLVQYSDALSLRTNGKSDGSVNLDRAADPATDEITMVLTGALPLALRPEAKTAAVIGIGTGLTTHTLLQSFALEHVDTVEIEAAMVEASRGFLPRNRGAYADPRGTVVIDDAKTFFAARNRRYDVIVSEPSNPWVSGVSGLFTREFYRRVREHLADGGILLQWFQLYEIDASLVASVMTALGGEFSHYAVYAASDHDLLIVASQSPLRAADPRVFEQPALAKELWTIRVLTVGDLDARYLGSRETLEPLFASYGMPPNSDYAPVLDLNAARHRFTERSAGGVVDLLDAGVPVLELLDPGRSARPVNPLFRGAETFTRVENTRLAWYARNFLVAPSPPEPRAVPTWLQKDLEILKARVVECRDPRELDVWLHSALRVAQATIPYLAPNDLNAVWPAFMVSRCYPSLTGLQRRWLALFRAVAARDAPGMATIAEELLATQRELSNETREYLVLAAMAGAVASGQGPRAIALWNAQKADLRSAAGTPVFRLLRCQAGREGCATDFSAYDER